VETDLGEGALGEDAAEGVLAVAVCGEGGEACDRRVGGRGLT
jgi:hypothetical protein